METKMYSKADVEKIIEKAFNEGYQYSYYETILGASITPKSETITELINNLTH